MVWACGFIFVAITSAVRHLVMHLPPCAQMAKVMMQGRAGNNVGGTSLGRGWSPISYFQSGVRLLESVPLFMGLQQSDQCIHLATSPDLLT